MPTLEFQNLPLVEVRARLRPEPPVRVDFGCIYAAHESVKSNFPTATFMDSIQQPIGKAVPHQFQMGLPIGATFSNTEGTIELTLQSTLLSATWRSRSFTNRDKYIRFPGLMSAMRDIVGAIDGDQKFTVANIAYTNLVEIGHHPTGADVGKYISGSVPESILKDAGILHDLSFSWRHGDGFDLRVQVNSTQGNPSSDVVDSYLLTTTCGILFEATSDPFVHLDNAHTLMNEAFAGIITDYAKTEWQFGGMRAS